MFQYRCVHTFEADPVSPCIKVCVTKCYHGHVIMLQHGHVHKFEEDQVALPQICGHDGDNTL